MILITALRETSWQHINKQKSKMYKAKKIFPTFVCDTSDNPAATPITIAANIYATRNRLCHVRKIVSSSDVRLRATDAVG